MGLGGRVEVGVRVERRSIPFRFRRASRSDGWTGGGGVTGRGLFVSSWTSTGDASDAEDDSSWSHLPERLASVEIVVVVAPFRSLLLPPSSSLPLSRCSYTSDRSTSTSTSS